MADLPAQRHKQRFAIPICRLFLAFCVAWLGIVSARAAENATELRQFFEAALYGDLQQVKTMLEGNPELLHQRGEYGFSVLHEVATEQQSAVQRYLLEKGADPNATDDLGNTPLHMASYVSYAKLLVAFGAEVNAVNRDGDTPLHCHAGEQEGSSMVAFLLQEAADPTKRNRRNETAEMIAAHREDAVKVNIFRRFSGKN